MWQALVSCLPCYVCIMLALLFFFLLSNSVCWDIVTHICDCMAIACRPCNVIGASNGVIHSRMPQNRCRGSMWCIDSAPESMRARHYTTEPPKHINLPITLPSEPPEHHTTESPNHLHHQMLQNQWKSIKSIKNIISKLSNVPKQMEKHNKHKKHNFQTIKCSKTN